MGVLGVSAVADGDERHDALSDIDAAASERLAVTAPGTRDEHDDRLAAPTMIASPIRLHFTPLRARPDRPSALRPPVSFLPQFKRAGPDRFYIEPVSRSTLTRFGFHT